MATDKEERKRQFREEFPQWFRDKKRTPFVPN